LEELATKECSIRVIFQKRSRSATDSTERSIFHNAPFLQRALETVAKVALGLLKDHAPLTEPESSDREQGPAEVGWAVSKSGLFDWLVA
jgi:hypothetical protein